jgi:tight adherence protein B
MLSTWTPPLLAALLLGASVVLAVLALGRLHRAWGARFTDAARVSLAELFVFIDPVTVFRTHLLLLVLLPALAWALTGVWAGVLPVALVTAALPHALHRALRSRRKRRLLSQLPDALTWLAASLRAGASLQAALSTVVRESAPPLSQEFSLVLRAQRLGTPLEDALGQMGRRLRMEDIDLFVSALSMAHDVGGNLARTLDRLAGTLGTKAALEGRIRALTAQGKLQGWVVGLLPLALGAVLCVLDPASMQPLFTTPVGWTVMAGVALLLLLGGFFIHRVVSIEL